MAAVLIKLEVTRGMFWMVPQLGESLRVIVTHVPGGKSSGTGSVRLYIKPYVWLPPYRMLFGNVVMGRRPSSRQNAYGR